MIAERVVLVNDRGEATGSLAKTEVHTRNTPLHLAFSLHLFDARGRVLVTRRALGKTTWPGVWTNSCCGHPGVAEALPDAVRRRAAYELGVEVSDPRCVLPAFAYSATDASGIRENEICPVYVARLHPGESIRSNGSEVMDWVWTEWTDLVTATAIVPFAFSPWAVEQVQSLPDSPCP